MQQKISLGAKYPLAFSVWTLVALLAVPLAASAKFSSVLQGQSKGATNWIGNNLEGWQDCDYIPMRVYVSGGSATAQAIEVYFDHFHGDKPGVEDLSGFTASPNVAITAGPTLNAPATSGTWYYNFTINLTDKSAGFVEFRGRLAAGAHLNTGSSLHLGGTPSLSTLQIFKPAPASGSPDLAVLKEGPAQAAPGAIITYTVNYTNSASCASAATKVQLSDVFPAAVTYVTNSASGNAAQVGNSLFWDLGDLPRGASGAVTYQVRVNSNTSNGQTFTNYAQIFSAEDDANYADNLSRVITTVMLNRAPEANNDAYSMNEDGILNVAAPGVLANDTDSDGNTLTALVMGLPAHGSLSFSTNGAFIYTPAANYNGPDSFTYRASDGQASSGLATVTITVQPVNDAPVALNDAYSVIEDTMLSIAAPGVLANDTDGDGDALTAILVSGPSHGSLTLNGDGSFRYLGVTDYNGPDSFTYKANDGILDSGVATVIITVNVVNDAPSFTKGPNQLVSEDAAPQTIANWATGMSAGPPDEAGQTLTFLVTGDTNALFSVQPAVSPDGTLSYTPAPHAYGLAHVTVSLKDNGGTANGGVDTSPAQIFTITVNAPPTVSIIEPTNQTIFIAPANITVIAEANDVDGTVSQVRILQGPNVLLETNAGPYLTTWTNVMAGSYQFTAEATDNLGASAISSPVNITVLEHPPMLVIQPPRFNPQTGLFEEVVRILNPTPVTLTAVRVLAGDLQAGMQVFNASGKTNGIAFAQSNLPILPGGSFDMTIEYYVPNFQTPNPTLTADVVGTSLSAASVGVAFVPVTRQLHLADGTFLMEFNSLQSRIYFVQYSMDMRDWRTAWPSIGGTGNRIQWIDNGPPRTDRSPAAERCRFYRVGLAP